MTEYQEMLRRVLREEFRRAFGEFAAAEPAPIPEAYRYSLTSFVHWKSPVLERGSAGEWDDDRLRDPNPIFDHLAGKYRLYYVGREAATGQHRVGMAESTDLVAWTKRPENPLLGPGAPGEFDEALYSPVDPCVVVKHVSGEYLYNYYMFYQALGTVDGVANVYSIGLAKSSDGVAWEKVGQVLKPWWKFKSYEGCASPVAWLCPHRDRWMMMFEILRGDWVGFAVAESRDGGLSWELLKEHPYAHRIYPESIVQFGGKYVALFNGMFNPTGPYVGVSLNGVDWYIRPSNILAWELGREVMSSTQLMPMGPEARRMGDRIVLYFWDGFDIFLVEAYFPFPSGTVLWKDVTVPTAGKVTKSVENFESVTFYLRSNVSGDLYVQVWDYAAQGWVDAYLAGTGTEFAETPAIKAKRMRLRFVPTAEAVVSAWAEVMPAKA